MFIHYNLNTKEEIPVTFSSPNQPRKETAQKVYISYWPKFKSKQKSLPQLLGWNGNGTTQDKKKAPLLISNSYSFVNKKRAWVMIWFMLTIQSSPCWETWLTFWNDRSQIFHALIHQSLWLHWWYSDPKCLYLCTVQVGKNHLRLYEIQTRYVLGPDLIFFVPLSKFFFQWRIKYYS